MAHARALLCLQWFRCPFLNSWCRLESSACGSSVADGAGANRGMSLELYDHVVESGCVSGCLCSCRHSAAAAAAACHSCHQRPAINLQHHPALSPLPATQAHARAGGAAHARADGLGGAATCPLLPPVCRARRHAAGPGAAPHPAPRGGGPALRHPMLRLVGGRHLRRWLRGCAGLASPGAGLAGRGRGCGAPAAGCAGGGVGHCGARQRGRLGDCAAQRRVHRGDAADAGAGAGVAGQQSAGQA